MTDKAIRGSKTRAKNAGKRKELLALVENKHPKRSAKKIVPSKKGKPSKEQVLKAENNVLKMERDNALKQYGEALSALMNYKIKAGKALGYIIFGLSLLGIGPDEILDKCNEMFNKNTPAKGAKEGEK